MGVNKTYAVFGLGRYGYSVVNELVNSGADVIAVDINPSVVNEMADKIPVCKCADITDPAVIRQLGISNVDVVVISIASNLEASVMATALCKEAGVKTVIAKCANEMHRKILMKIGADRVVFPESESGVRLAKNLLSSGFIDIIELSHNVSMIELEMRPQWVGKHLMELDLRKKYSINVVAIKNNGSVTTEIDPSTPLEASMTLIVIADTSKLSRLK